MPLTRRQALASAAAAIATTVAKPAIAAKEPILIGYLPALTGPSSSTGMATATPISRKLGLVSITCHLPPIRTKGTVRLPIRRISAAVTSTTLKGFWGFRGPN